jgi:hypothetical protein
MLLTLVETVSNRVISIFLSILEWAGLQTTFHHNARMFQTTQQNVHLGTKIMRNRDLQEYLRSVLFDARKLINQFMRSMLCNLLE